MSSYAASLWFYLKYLKGFVVLFSLPCISVRNHCNWILGNQNKANGPAQTTPGSNNHTHEDDMDQVVFICAYFSTSSYQGVHSERARAGCRHLVVSVQPQLSQSQGFFFKSTGLRIELSFIALLTLIIFFFTSTSNTVRMVLNYYENKAVGIVIYASLHLSYKQLWPSWHHFTFSETHRRCPCQLDQIRNAQNSQVLLTGLPDLQDVQWRKPHTPKGSKEDRSGYAY